ncbi:MAG: hypothetical protein NW223_23975 [Hyphomicrobiaceae bacterium]|nr:hypothetical protein [Hyphomicrobiaceae bacterium]
MRTIAIAALLALPPAVAWGQAFDFTPAQFQERFNRQLKADEGDLLRACRPEKAAIACTFEDAKFQRSVQAFKELNLVNGRFELKSRVLIEQAGGKVATIAITGDRSSPMGLFHFAGQMGSLMRSFDPALTSQQAAAKVSELGVMRGDADRTIGTPKLAIENYAAIECTSWPSSRSTSVGCVFRPRY